MKSQLFVNQRLQIIEPSITQVLDDSLIDKPHIDRATALLYVCKFEHDVYEVT